MIFNNHHMKTIKLILNLTMAMTTEAQKTVVGKIDHYSTGQQLRWPKEWLSLDCLGGFSSICQYNFIEV